MRQPQQKSRSRGRGRKPQNPLSRNYESNGPDVKIRGNATHIADKYSQLARDALSNGDTVMAENYLQHAEHYNRIVAAAQQQQQQQNAARNEENQQSNGRDQQPSGEPAAEADGSAPKAETVEAEGAEREAAEEQASAPRARSTRRRKAAPANGNGSDEAKAESEPAVEVPDGVSDDAAKLPGSIIGAVPLEENG